MVGLSSTCGLAARLAALCALVAAAACTDGVTSPTARPAEDALAARGKSSPGLLHTGKYRDSSAPHATGRSGSARIEARALLGADGVTRLLVTTGSVDDPDRAPGELAKVQLKIYAPDGTKLATLNFHRFTTGGSYEFLLPGLSRGTRIDVQANVRGIDRNRTDVVNVSETVKLGASLGVSIDPPAQVPTGVPTVIAGTVTETGGEVGTYTSCVLYVDGVEVDRIDNVWVDAGDAVSCAFTHTFTRTGTYDVEIRLEGGPDGQGLVGPPPAASGDVNAVDPTPVPTFTASVMDRTVAEERLYDETWWKPDGSDREYHQNNGEAARTQTFAMTGTIARAATFPLVSVSVQVGSNAGPWHSAQWSGLAAAAPDVNGQSCVNQLAPEHGAHFYLCSTGSGFTGSTSFGYTRFAGTVTYHSRAFHRQWDAVLSEETTYSWNNVSETYAGGGQMRPLGSEVSFDVDVTDGDGSIPVGGTIPLTSFESSLVLAPYVCREEMPYWLFGGIKTVCEGATQRTFGWSGEISG